MNRPSEEDSSAALSHVGAFPGKIRRFEKR